CWNGELARKIERHLAADAGKDVTLARGIERAPADHKNVAAHPLGEISVDVEQHRPALGIVRFHRLLRDDHVQVVVRLSARAEHVRCDAALRGRPYIETVAELTRARLERQRRAFHNYVRTAVLGRFITDRIDATTDALADPPIASRGAQMFVALHELLRHIDHLPRTHSGIQTQITEGTIEAVNVLLEPEGATVKGARHVE